MSTKDVYLEKIPHLWAYHNRSSISNVDFSNHLIKYWIFVSKTRELQGRVSQHFLQRILAVSDTNWFNDAA